ncbi:MAG: transglutaminase domain-containing protein [Planctomycetes bacterium]|nr:transglutaminase domain-containing protein [Planctomycetota bacterium]
MTTILLSLAVLLAVGCPDKVQPADPDADRDGLSDFQETHKYFTDPKSADSDKDGLPDGDWEERREFAYTVRSIVHVLPPVTEDVLCDDYQDARILEKSEDYVELEVIHYPLNTVADAIAGNPDWRRDAARMKDWVAPGLTANWDEEMRGKLVASLKKEGIDPDALDDKGLVERASKWLLGHARSVDGFSTFCSWFPGGKAAIYPGLEESAERGKAGKGLTVEEQWQRELFAKGMFENAVRGTCTSSAIYMNGCLKALGIPTRIVLCIPVVDASDEREVGFVRSEIRHARVRGAILRAVQGQERSWTSHTFNEVFVGGRWRRLNYERLGQGILDPNYLGLMTHVATFRDWADGEMAKTWGLRSGGKWAGRDVFGGPNPYSAVALSDRFGPNAKVDSEEFRSLTIERVYWWDSPERTVEMQLDDRETAGHLLMHVREGRSEEGTEQYATFYGKVSKGFVLRAEGRPDVRAGAARGYWVDSAAGMREFYLRIEPSELPKVTPGVPYSLVPVGENETYRWVVADGVKVVRLKSGERPPKPKADVTIARAVWSDAAEIPEEIRKAFSGDRPVLLCRVAEKKDAAELKEFTSRADLRFFLEAEGQPTLKVGADVGSVTSGADLAWVVVRLGPADWEGLAADVGYRLRPQNARPGSRWAVADGVVVPGRK